MRTIVPPTTSMASSRTATPPAAGSRSDTTPGDRPGGISIIDLTDGSRRDVLVGNPPFPAFHAWGECLYYRQTVDGKLMLRRCRYDTVKAEDVAELPPDWGRSAMARSRPITATTP